MEGKRERNERRKEYVKKAVSLTLEEEKEGREREASLEATFMGGKEEGEGNCYV